MIIVAVVVVVMIAVIAVVASIVDVGIVVANYPYCCNTAATGVRRLLLLLLLCYLKD